MADKLWKVVERKIAKYIGGIRVPVTGRQRGSAPDIAHQWLSIEVKHRNKLPDWIHDAMAQAIASKIDMVQIPVVFLHEKNKSVENTYAMILTKDLKELLEVFVNE